MNNHGRDIIGIFAQHKVAANLLMLVFLIAGFVSLSKLNTQFFPNFALDIINVQVTWRGASAEDVEDAITNRIEQELRNVDYVKKMTSTSSFGSSMVTLEFEENTDMGPTLDQVKQKISLIRNLPTDSETPDVSLITAYENVARLLITTDGELNELRPFAQQIEDELLNKGIAKVIIDGLPKQEIAIQIDSKKLASLGMSLGDVSERVGQLSQDLPAGEIGTNESARQLRSLEQRHTTAEFSSLPLKTNFEGGLVLLGDVATIERRPMQKQSRAFYQGKPAIVITLQRTEHADSLASAKILQDWIEENRNKLPQGVHLKVYDESWTLIEERINLLLTNGLGGLILVVGILYLFLHNKVAIWVAIGIPVSFMATLFIMFIAGGSINMISLFGLIMALGIIVDDAIVVGEDALAHFQKGERALHASEGGAKRMLAPVISSSLTTIASFLPLMMISGVMGNILFDIPFVVICVIIASLFESFLILPGHLRHAFHSIKTDTKHGVRHWLDSKFNYLRDDLFEPLVRKAVNYRWLTIMSAVGLLIIVFGLLVGGRIQFTFFPSPESTVIYANARFTAGTPATKVDAFLVKLNQALNETKQALDEDIVDVALTFKGKATSAGGIGDQVGDRFGSMQIQLTSPDARDVRNTTFINEWRKRISFPAGMESFTISEMRAGPPGKDLDVRLTGNSAPQLKRAAQEFSTILERYPGVSAIEDDMPYGQEQLIYRIKPEGEVLGLTVTNVGNQLRAAFDGQLVQIFQDGKDEIEVRVMLPDSERNTMSSLQNIMLRLPNGGTVPLGSVVEFDAQRGFDVLRHSDGHLAVHITASVDSATNNSNAIINDLKQTVLPQLISRYRVDIAFEGRAQEQRETVADMESGGIIALIVIYIVLAWVFSSYGWPLVVMAAIPFGLIGALFGHWLMGIDLTILSLFGIFGLAGIVVNDSIILVTFFKQQREAGVETGQAIINAATQRLRAVLLTSLTTISGLTPLLFETSIQAQFLIPMAVSISFGLMFSTVLVLLVIPALLSVNESAVTFLLQRNKHKLSLNNP